MTSAAPAGRRPNILFILTDDHAAHAISAYGSVVNRTPHIDEIGDAGVPVRHLLRDQLALRAEPGVHPDRHLQPRQRRDAPSTRHRRHAADLRHRCCGTPATAPAFVGKWHMGDGEPTAPRPAGLRLLGRAHRPGRVPRPAVPLRGRAPRRARLRHRPHHRPGAATGSTRCDGDDPWCLLVWHKAPHRPWEPDDAHAGMYADRQIPVPATFDDDFATRSDTARRAAMRDRRRTSPRRT